MIYDVCMAKNRDLTSINQLVTHKARVPRKPAAKVLGSNKGRAKPWFLYIIECADGSLYTGVAVDVHLRYAAHVTGSGARYTRARPPRRLLLCLQYPDRSAALKAEYALKQLGVAQKRAYVNLYVPDWRPGVRDLAVD